MEEVVVEELQGLIRLKIEINIILYNPNKGGINTRFASHSIDYLSWLFLQLAMT